MQIKISWTNIIIILSQKLNCSRQNKFHNKIWQKKNTYFNENIPKTKYLTLKIKRKT